MLKEKIQSDLTAAMRAKDTERLSTLRMLNAAMQRETIELRAKEKEPTDDDILAVIRREVKQHNDAIEEYTKGERKELAEKEEREKKILEAYLPAQITDEALDVIIQEAIASLHATTPQDFGKVMGAVVQKTKGQADGKKVAKLVKKVLTKS